MNLSATFLIAAFAASGAAQEPQPTPTFSPSTSSEELKNFMVEYSDLKDPFSVEFRRVEIKVTDKLTVWCGQLNAKNSSGGYIGWHDFAAIKGTNPNKLFLDADDTGFVDRIMIRGMCKDASIATGWAQ